ncbi:LodA/GoxA family CTQ-dependent oxidase [Sphingobacterium sp. MYb382]|uniref:LodA/GoxA family CTQ-dependent oxidase n=1 Tax=Sphingobacterium sp. MYb382 TaxID=2745278 RepID=UPI0030A513E0
MFYRDKTGKLKRQAAEFRIYGLDKNDKIICELTNEDDVKIEWHVQLANQKSEWYGFSIALDIPEAKDYPASFKRNLDCKNRMDLIIDSKVQTLSAKNKAIDLIGKIGDESKEVYLGSIKYADNSKRLHVLGGKGVADNISKFNDGKTIPATTFSTIREESWNLV